MSPKGKKAKVAPPIVTPPKAEVSDSPDPRPAAPKAAEKPKLDPLGPDQQYFEAPNGDIIIGSKDQQRAFHRASGTWINPKR